MTKKKNQTKGLNLFPKQQEALRVLLDPDGQYKEVFQVCYAGAIRSSKTYTAAVLVLILCINHAGIRGAVVRKNRNTLERDWTHALNEVWSHYVGDEVEPPFTITGGANVTVRFTNGSEVQIMGQDEGRDESFNKLRGWSGSFAILEEAQEQPSEALLSQLGSRLSQAGEYSLSPKVLIIGNPAPKTHWFYREFYQKWKEGTLEPHKYFILALITDNQTLSPEYLKMQQMSMTEADLQINFYGNWEFVSEEDNIFDIQDIQLAYSQGFIESSTDRSYITVDPATDAGKDSTIITVWLGKQLVEVLVEQSIDSQSLVQKVRQLKAKYDTADERVIIDANGIGYAICQQLEATPFLASGKAQNDEPYLNLRCQLYFKLAEQLRLGEVSFPALQHNSNLQIQLSEELLAHKHIDRYKGGKNKVSPKDNVKLRIRRSPDLSDAVSFRMFYEYIDDEMIIEF